MRSSTRVHSLLVQKKKWINISSNGVCVCVFFSSILIFNRIAWRKTSFSVVEQWNQREKQKIEYRKKTSKSSEIRLVLVYFELRCNLCSKRMWGFSWKPFVNANIWTDTLERLRRKTNIILLQLRKRATKTVSKKWEADMKAKREKNIREKI